jgi:hypothetical protein
MLVKDNIGVRKLARAGLMGIMSWFMAGCQESSPPPVPKPIFGQTLPWSGEPFDLMAEDINGDSHLDLTVMDHGGNNAQLFYQDAQRQWSPGPSFTGVGFHPGNLFRWPGDPARYILSAEGDNAVRVLTADAAAGFKIESQLNEVKPRYGNRFRWPGWGDSLVLSPFDMDSLFLLKDYDPAQGKAAERIHVPLAEQPPSVLWPGPITVTDIDADGSDDLLYATPVTRQVFVVQAPRSVPITPKKKQKPKQTPIKPRLLATDPLWGGPSQVVDGELNGDGWVDLLVPDETLPGKINVLVNVGQGSFKAAPSIDSPHDQGITELKTARDKDGLRYILSAGYGFLALYQVPIGWVPEQPLTPRAIRWKKADHATALALQDLDGDGWLDLVLGRSNGEKRLWVLYGPLWDRFAAMTAQQYDLDN